MPMRWTTAGRIQRGQGETGAEQQGGHFGLDFGRFRYLAHRIVSPRTSGSIVAASRQPGGATYCRAYGSGLASLVGRQRDPGVGQKFVQRLDVGPAAGVAVVRVVQVGLGLVQLHVEAGAVRRLDVGAEVAEQRSTWR